MSESVSQIVSEKSYYINYGDIPQKIYYICKSISSAQMLEDILNYYNIGVNILNMKTFGIDILFPRDKYLINSDYDYYIMHCEKITKLIESDFIVI